MFTAKFYPDILVIMTSALNKTSIQGFYCLFSNSNISISYPCAEHCRGVSLLHMHGETEGCSPLPTLLQTVLLQLHTSKTAHIRLRAGDVLCRTKIAFWY